MHWTRWCNPAIKELKKNEKFEELEKLDSLKNEPDEKMEYNYAQDNVKKADNKENIDLKCEKCGEYMKSKSGLFSHMRGHLVREAKALEIEKSKEEIKPKDKFFKHSFSNGNKLTN